MISVDDKGIEWLGWINIKEEALAVYARVVSQDDRKLDLQSIQVDLKLIEQFKSLKEKKWFIDHLSQMDNIALLPQFLQEALSTEPPTTLALPLQEADNIPQLLISELDSIGWEHFVSVNQRLDVIKLKTADSRGFEHQFEVHISPHYPFQAPGLTVDLPVRIQLSADSEMEREEDVFSFVHILNSVQIEINKYVDLFTVLRDLDEHTKILEPSSTSFGIVSRRLAVSRTCSIKLTLDPLQLRELCQVTYMGPQEEVMTLRHNFGKNVTKWSPSDLVRVNLQNLLETTFIEPSTVDDLSYLNECGICYSYQLLGVGGATAPTTTTAHYHPSESLPEMITPEQMCLNRKCGRLFHTACLISWLQAVPTNKTSFGTLFGSCPYCSESISVRTFH